MTDLLHRQRPALVLLVAVALASTVVPLSAVATDTSVTIAIYALIALSVGLSWGQAGILSIAQAAFAAMGAYATSIVTIRWDLSPYLGLLLAIVVPAAVAYPLARVVTRLAALSLSIATFAFGEIFYTAVRQGGDLTGGYIGLSGAPEVSIAPTFVSFHYLGWACVVVVVALYSNLRASARGRALRTIRHDRIRAAADGVNVPHTLGSLFALSAAVTGLAGWLYAHYITYVGPESLDTNLSISVLLMAVIGGAATVLGPVVGAALLTVADQFLPAEEAKGLFYGAVLILALLVLPKGLLGMGWPLRSRRRNGRGEQGPAAPVRDETRPLVAAPTRKGAGG
ncbi:branched-chain amino acid ABC transporter permease [Pseudonocardia kunmingensis]|uniref:Amino acid/amide ABC transporter membrane protein 2 (HAAT family) n=1 Tax=Pseudonocardia kunmingensis TaxID=630975 RepID=A0A543DVL1_9PSEU|nr:branched-chain amino acid ABC transporter permease [Pseudonocardia kunmingensis]TQM13354.1 amino acid/amide ABC transporter membrane protein 2 (HAAT family) [Pseudonocardia kunmingensis]